MKLAAPIRAFFAVMFGVFVSINFRSAARDTNQPDLAITPSTIRIQSLLDNTKGYWVVMTGFSELGSPTFSRDGQWIAFDAYKEGFNNSSAECWIARKDGQKLKQLAFGATPRFSPDGKQLLFVREEVNDQKREPGIFTINTDGLHEKRIGPGRWPDWSPDGKQIVFSVGGEELGGARIGATICIAKADGSNCRELIDGDCPSWSPDGTKIAYCYRLPERPPLIRVYDIRKKAETTLGIGYFRANWMPDSKTVVANGASRRRQGMVRLSLRSPGSAVDQPTEYEDPSSPCISWDGTEIVFIAKRPEPESR